MHKNTSYTHEKKSYLLVGVLNNLEKPFASGLRKKYTLGWNAFSFGMDVICYTKAYNDLTALRGIYCEIL